MIKYSQTLIIDNECFSVIRVVKDLEDFKEQAGWLLTLTLTNEVNEESLLKEEPLKKSYKKTYWLSSLR